MICILKVLCCILKSSQSFQNGVYLHSCFQTLSNLDFYDEVVGWLVLNGFDDWKQKAAKEENQAKKLTMCIGKWLFFKICSFASKCKNNTFTRSYVLDIVLASDSDLLESCQRCEVARQPAKNPERYRPGQETISRHVTPIKPQCHIFTLCSLYR